MTYFYFVIIVLYKHKVKAICRNMSKYNVLSDTHRTAEKIIKQKLKTAVLLSEWLKYVVYTVRRNVPGHLGRPGQHF